MNFGTTTDWLRLHLTPGLGRKAIYRLIETYDTPETALLATPGDWVGQCGIRAEVANRRIGADHPLLHDALRQMESANATLVSFWDREEYPVLLRNIHDPPALLYVRGRLCAQEALAVVGSRRASRGGKAFARQVASDLASAGICIVSGLARGIDTAAHRGALDANGKTVAVLGCGIDQIYPAENNELFLQIETQGAILSEYPPGTLPLPGHFPGRNRIISGLARGVLIVEAATGSGSLHTAEFALESGREVFAVPNAVQMPTGYGVNQLIKDGARVVTESRDILETLWPGRIATSRPTRDQPETLELPDNQRRLLNLLGFNPLHRDDMIRKSTLTPMELSDILLHLELAGLIIQLPGGHFVRTH